MRLDALQWLTDATGPDAENRAYVCAQAGVDGDLRWVIQKLKALLQDAEGDEDRLMQLGSLKELRQSLMALAELQGKLAKELVVHLNLNESPQFPTLRSITLTGLDRHPDAKGDFLAEMRALKVIEAR